MITINPNVNINTKTGIRYGIISANEIDSDFLADFEAIYPKLVLI